MKLRVGILWEFFPTLFCVNFGKFTQNSHQNENDYLCVNFVGICRNSHKICVNLRKFPQNLCEFCGNFVGILCEF